MSGEKRTKGAQKAHKRRTPLVRSRTLAADVNERRRSGESDVEIAASIPCSTFHLRRLAGSRRDALKQPPVEPEPKAAPEPAQRVQDGESKPPGAVIDILLMGAGPVVNGRVQPRSVMRSREDRGERLTRSVVGTEARGEFDGLLSGVAAAYRENDVWDAKVRAVEDALERGEHAVDFMDARTGKVERLTRDDISRLRHRLRA